MYAACRGVTEGMREPTAQLDRCYSCIEIVQIACSKGFVATSTSRFP